MQHRAGHSIGTSIVGFKAVLVVKVTNVRRLNLSSLLRDINRMGRNIKAVKFSFRGMTQHLSMGELKRLVAGFSDQKQLLRLEAAIRG